ncbi:MAG: HNH endonuclease [Sphingopyxis sp.]
MTWLASPDPKSTELPCNAARPCLTELPYRAIVHIRDHAGTSVPLYQAAGAQGGPFGAEKALKAAHKVHGGNCFYCKKPVAHADMTIDHIEPKSRGGTSSIQNLVVACKPCNSAKGHLPIEAYKPGVGAEWLQALLRQVEDRLRQVGVPVSRPLPPQPAPDATADP